MPELNASEFVADALRGAFLSSKLGNYTKQLVQPDQPPLWETWGIGLLTISACSFSAPLGMLLLPCLSPGIYDRIMTFLVAVGIGALSGSCFFVMIPQAFHLTVYEEIDYISKSWLIISALYTFLVVDRLLQYFLEFRRRRNTHRKVHVSTISKILENKSRQTTETYMEEDEMEKQDKETIKTELELSMLNNAFARTFSTRRRVAVLRPVEGIEFVDEPQHKHSPLAFDIPHSLSPSSHHRPPTPHKPRYISTPPPTERQRAISVTLPCAANNDEWRRPYVNSTTLDRERSIQEAREAATARRRSISSIISTAPQSPQLGMRASALPQKNAFVDELNCDVQQIYSPCHNTLNQRRRSSLDHRDLPMKAIGNGIEKMRPIDDDEISVKVQVLDKHVVDPTQVEVASVAYMIVFGSSANNFVDGMSMGAAFSDSLLKGISIGIAVVSQQFPQELGTLAILANTGLGLKRTLLVSLIPTSLSFVGFTFGVLLDTMDDSYDSYIFAISSGMYLYIFLGTLVPEIRDASNELIRTDIIESLIVTAIQIAGIATGIFLMFFMGQFKDIALEVDN